VIYLDSAVNRKGKPNENFAREVMELFTLGEGNYGENDIKEAARAFTGWGLDLQTGEFLFRPAQHDDGQKTVLGRTGNLGGEAVLDILLEQPKAAEYLVGKMWREFISPQPDPAEIKRIGALFRDSRYDVRTALKALLVSDAFYAPANRGTLIKSPVDLVVGTLRQFQFQTGDMLPFAFATSQLGQALFEPPNVKGWPGGEAWINSTTLLRRKAFLDRLFRVEELRPVMATSADGGDMSMDNMETPRDTKEKEGRERYQGALMNIRFESSRWLAQFGTEDPARLQRMILAAAPVSAPPEGAKGMELIRHYAMDPVYQLK
jgi:uncharacterized protein (DUF1800 family)